MAVNSQNTESLVRMSVPSNGLRRNPRFPYGCPSSITRARRLGVLFVATSTEAGEQHANQERQRDKKRREARERVARGKQNASKTKGAQDGYQTDVCASCLAPAGSIETAMVHRMLVFLLSDRHLPHILEQPWIKRLVLAEKRRVRKGRAGTVL